MIGFALPALFEQVTWLQARLPQNASQLEKLLTQYGEQLSTRLGVDFDVSRLTLSYLSESSSLGQAVLVNVSNRVLNFVIIIFDSLFGTIGVILAVPAIAAGKTVFKNIYADLANASLKSAA